MKIPHMSLLLPLPGVALGIAPGIGLHMAQVMRCTSESCSENAPEFLELLRAWLFRSKSVFSCSRDWGGMEQHRSSGC